MFKMIDSIHKVFTLITQYVWI